MSNLAKTKETPSQKADRIYAEQHEAVADPSHAESPCLLCEHTPHAGRCKAHATGAAHGRCPCVFYRHPV
jgi:hypothetical protein